MSLPAFLAPAPIGAHPLRPALPAVAKRARTGAPVAKLSLPPLRDFVARARDDAARLSAVATKGFALAALVAALAVPLDGALAASGGGRIGGSSFRAPAPRVRVAPPSSYGRGFGGYGGYGGVSPGYYGVSPGPIFLNPFIMPLGGFGFSGFGSLFLFAAAAAFLYEAAKTRNEEAEIEREADPVTAVTVLKVGLLANARELQVNLDTLARSADTTTLSGLRYVLGETVTSLLRNPDYWVYGSVKVASARLSKAEGQFERLCLEERLKLDEETLTNAAGMRSEMARASARTTDMRKAPNEYIVVSLIVAAAGDLITRMPKSVDDVADINRALRALAGVSRDSLQGVEVTWAPQSLRDSLTERELLADHPELKRL